MGGVRAVVVALAAAGCSVTLQGCGDSADGGVTVNNPYIGQTYGYGTWSNAVKAGLCSDTVTPMKIDIAPRAGSGDAIYCSLENGVKVYKFPPGVFEIDEQMLVPEKTTIAGNRNPNTMSDPTRPPDYKYQTLFLATRGVTDYNMNYCHAKDMVKTRVGFVLSSYVTVVNVSYQGIDTIRPMDNGALCGGGAFETKGCAENDCNASDVNNGGSDGVGSAYVAIENVRLNDWLYQEDKRLVGNSIPGNYDCKTEDWKAQCCFCKPNGIRASQVGIWVPQSRNEEGSHHIVVRNLVASALQADGINFHGKVDHTRVENTYIQNTGDDVFVIWGAALNPVNITFKDSVAVNPGILRPNWYGNCVATYGLQSAVFERLTCRAPMLQNPIPSPNGGAVTIDNSMFVFYTSFGASYPAKNSITIKGAIFTDLSGKEYLPDVGVLDRPVPHRMVWTKSENGKVAPYYLTSDDQKVFVFVYQESAGNQYRNQEMHA